MSRLNVKEALLGRLLANLPTGASDSDVARKNQKPPFDPAGKSMWLESHIVEASSETTGKSINDSDEQRGFFQIDVRVPLVDDMQDNALLYAIDELATAFKFGTNIVYNGQTVSILDSTPQNLFEDGAWYRGLITINYLTISERV